MSSRSKKCGPHVELVSNDSARITRCTCGTLHVHLHTNGVTLRFDESAFRHVANAFGAAQRLVDLAERAGESPKDAVN